MAYADQEGMSRNRLVSIIIVLLLHAFLGYALVTGLAFEAVQKVKEKLNVIDVKEEELERAVQRRASRSGVRPEDVPREAVRKELLEEISAREIRNWFDRATSKSKRLHSTS